MAIHIDHWGYNVEPICSDPQDGCMSTGGGLRLCTNPEHYNSESYIKFGPVWHKQSEWPGPDRVCARCKRRGCGYTIPGCDNE